MSRRADGVISQAMQIPATIAQAYPKSGDCGANPHFARTSDMGRNSTVNEKQSTRSLAENRAMFSKDDRVHSAGERKSAEPVCVMRYKAAEVRSRANVYMQMDRK